LLFWVEISAMGAYIDKKVYNFNRTESESYLQSIIGGTTDFVQSCQIKKEH
jgi:hypothetical protein